MVVTSEFEMAMGILETDDPEMAASVKRLISLAGQFTLVRVHGTGDEFHRATVLGILAETHAAIDAAIPTPGFAKEIRN